MTMNPHANNLPRVAVDTSIRVPSPRRKRPDLPVVFVGPPEIEARIRTRRGQLIARIVELRADGSPEAIEARLKLKVKLSALAFILREAANVSATVTAELDRWLANEID
jgi:hypothetical protein